MKTKTWTRPIISICRQSKSWAIFNEFELISGFFKYQDEGKALEITKRAIKEETEIEPEIVFPNIKRIRMS